MRNDSQKDWGIAMVRVLAGLIFLMHGQQKVFGFGLGAMQQTFAHMGFPAPEILGPFIALLELIGGVALIPGLLTRWACVLFSIEMAVAVFRVHLKGGFYLPKGYEFALTMGVMSMALAITGPGAAALDHVIFRRRE